MIKLYHISENDSMCKLTPRIPNVNNLYIKKGYEDAIIPRICAARTIGECLTGLMDYVKPGNIYYVYEFSVDEANVISNEEICRNRWVPCAHISKEVWVTTEVKPILTGKIEVTRVKDIIKSKFKNNGEIITHLAYTWKFKKLEMYLIEKLLFAEIGGRAL